MRPIHWSRTPLQAAEIYPNENAFIGPSLTIGCMSHPLE